MNKHADYVFFKDNIEPHYVDIIRFLVSATGDRELAKDIAQDTMEAAWKYINKMQTYDSVKAALIAIAKNNLKKHYSKYPAWTSTEELADIASSTEMTAEVVIEAETGEELTEMLKTLDKKYANVLLLRYYYDMSLNEIANMYGEKYSTIQSRHFRAIKKVNEIRIKNKDF